MEVWFGRYRGCRVSSCPIEFLEWIVRQEPLTTDFRLLQMEARKYVHISDDARAQEMLETGMDWRTGFMPGDDFL